MVLIATRVSAVIVFFRSHKRRPLEAPLGMSTAGLMEDVPEPSDDELEALERRLLLEQWRRCEQRVTRAWKVWQASDRRANGICYSALMSALAEEEQAAREVEARFAGVSSAH